ncbi:hypothetical protein [Micromonospora sp. NPDC005652]|uniref:hypothetical protein n=1 Tax=Micromonospora sp. NPDC005652 TaxID=3157046 RepID=UPI0033C584D1
METPDEMAACEGFPVVRVTNFDLMHMLAGHAMVHGTADGGKVTVRLATPNELLRQVEDAGRALEAQGLPPGPGMTREKAVELTTPIKLT